MASLRSFQKLPLCLTEAMPERSKTDPLPAKARIVAMVAGPMG